MTTEKFNEEVKDFQEEICKLVKSLFEDLKEIRPMVAAYKYRENAVKKEIGMIANIGELLKNEVTKKALKAALRDVFEDVKPLAIAFISEGWALSVPKNSVKSREALLEEMKDKSISEMAEKKEVVFVNLETANTHCGIVYDIDRTDSNNPKLTLNEVMTAEWVNKEDEIEGSLQNILNVDYYPIADLNSIN